MEKRFCWSLHFGQALQRSHSAGPKTGTYPTGSRGVPATTTCLCYRFQQACCKSVRVGLDTNSVRRVLGAHRAAGSPSHGLPPCPRRRTQAGQVPCPRKPAGRRGTARPIHSPRPTALRQHAWAPSRPAPSVLPGPTALVLVPLGLLMGGGEADRALWPRRSPPRPPSLFLSPRVYPAVLWCGRASAGFSCWRREGGAVFSLSPLSVYFVSLFSSSFSTSSSFSSSSAPAIFVWLAAPRSSPAPVPRRRRDAQPLPTGAWRRFVRGQRRGKDSEAAGALPRRWA